MGTSDESEQLMRLGGGRRKRPWPNKRYYSGICPRSTEKLRKNSVVRSRNAVPRLETKFYAINVPDVITSGNLEK